FNLIDNTVSATYGRSEYRDPKSIADLAKSMAKNRPTWKRPEERTEALADSGSGGPIREGGKASKQTATPRFSEPDLWSLVVTDITAGKVKIGLPGQVRKTMAMDSSGLV